MTECILEGRPRERGDWSRGEFREENALIGRIKKIEKPCHFLFTSSLVGWQILCPFFNWLILSYYYVVLEFFVYSWVKFFVLQIFSFYFWLTFSLMVYFKSKSFALSAKHGGEGGPSPDPGSFRMPPTVHPWTQELLKSHFYSDKDQGEKINPEFWWSTIYQFFLLGVMLLFPI